MANPSPPGTTSVKLPAMIFRQRIRDTSYVFGSLVELLAKASPLRAGDRLAGLAASSAEESMAAKLALADTPLETILASRSFLTKTTRSRG